MTSGNFRFLCTLKGKREGKIDAKLYVGILYGKEIVLCKHFNNVINFERYSNLFVPNIVQGIEASFNSITKHVLEGNCPVMY